MHVICYIIHYLKYAWSDYISCVWKVKIRENLQIRNENSLENTARLKSLILERGSITYVAQQSGLEKILLV